MATTNYYAFIATSLDGKIADPNGGIEWLHNPKYNLEKEDFGYKSFYDSMDCLIQGRNTFEKIQEFSEYPYTGKDVWVISKSNVSISENLLSENIFTETSIESLNKKLNESQIKSVYVDGGKLISSYFHLGLLTEITITHIPIILGEGLPLWNPKIDYRDKFLIPLNTRIFSNGFVQIRYICENNVSIIN